MKCKKCNGKCVKNGRRNGFQRFYCTSCRFSFQEEYLNESYLVTDHQIKTLVKEGCGIRSISRILKISPTTVISRIKQIAKSISKPTPIPLGKEYEIDELATYFIRKKKRIWVTYALRKDNREVIDFSVGTRSLKTMRRLTEIVVLSQPKAIFTDKFINYKTLIPIDTHVTRKRCINYIERMNLNLRTHLKRLNRRTLCYTKSVSMLVACLKIYFWG